MPTLRASIGDGDGVITGFCRVLFWVKMTGVCAPLIGIVVCQAKGLQQRLELEEYFILTATKDIR